MALGIVAYGYFEGTTWSGFYAALGAFFTTLFFVSSYFFVFQRAKKAVIDEMNHDLVGRKQDDVIERLKQLTVDLGNRQTLLLNKLEAITLDLEGNSTGGDSIAYISKIEPLQFQESADEKSPKEVRILITVGYTVVGKYPIRDLVLELTDADLFDLRFQFANSSGGMSTHELTAVMRPEQTIHIGYELPLSDSIENVKSVKILDIAVPFLPFHKNKISLNCTWKAFNGTWNQFIQFKVVDGQWQYASRVHKGSEDIHVFHSKKFPLDASNRPIFE